MRMSELFYSTDSDEHKINTGERQEEQWCELTDEEIKQDIMDSWDLYERMQLNKNKAKLETKANK